LVGELEGQESHGEIDYGKDKHGDFHNQLDLLPQT
jgi:hypothetical protein